MQNHSANTIARIQIDFDGDGAVDFTTTDSEASVERVYANPGVYLAKVILTDSLNQVVTIDQPIVAQDIATLDKMLRGIYARMLLRLRQGNIDAALTLVTGGAYEKYREVFTALEPNLGSIVDQLGEIRGGSISDEMAEYVVARNTPDGYRAFLIYFILSEDGIWRIDGM